MSSDDETQLADSLPHADTVGPSVEPRGGGGTDVLRFVDRYQTGELLGRGGMGEVHELVDRMIGRTVAVKTMRVAKGTGRFLREARVQGRLQHPAIVPVYDLGLDPDGRPYFTMKRLAGDTLSSVIERLREGDADTTARFNRHRLLSLFLDVCQAVAYAHQREVIHRDIKPANVMVGDFGEVYLLDWGVAHIRGETQTEDDLAASSMSDAPTPTTEVGAVLGTPGYMAPEQLAGLELDARADVHALGALLYELLFLERLYTGSALSVVDKMSRGIDWSAHGVATADVPPELVEICRRATSADRQDRHPSVRSLMSEVERYLEGDRDLKLRQQLAEQHVANARAMLDEAGAEARSKALQTLGRAIALDPAQPQAAALLHRVFAEPPTELPPEVRDNVRGAEQEAMRLQARMGGFAYLFWFFFVLYALWLGVKSTGFIIALISILVVVVVQAFWASSRPMSDRAVIVAGVLNAIAVAIITRLFGPFVLTPILAALGTTMLMLQPIRRGRPFLVVVGCASVLGPWLLEKVGVLAPSYRFGDESIEILANATYFAAGPAEFMLVSITIAVIVMPAVLTTRVRRLLQSLQERLEVQAWQLRQVVPATAPPDS